MNSYSNNNNILNIIEKYATSKYKYTFVEAILRILDPNIQVLDKNDKFEKIKLFKHRMAYDLKDKNLYKNFDYKLKIRKNYIYNQLTFQKGGVDINIKRYISIYLQLNILIIIENRYYVINKYNEKLGTIILIHNNNKFIPVFQYDKKINNYIKFYNHSTISHIFNEYNIDELYRYKDESDISQSEQNILKHLKTCKLGELQEYAQKYDINVNKYSDKNSYKFKSKSDLFEEIKNKIVCS